MFKNLKKVTNMWHSHGLDGGPIVLQAGTLGNWTDSRVLCRHSTPTTSFCFAAIAQYLAVTQYD